MGPEAIRDLEVTVQVDRSCLRWPTDSEAEDDSGLGMNRHYADIRKLEWKDVADVLEIEGAYITRLVAAADTALEYETINEERYEDYDPLQGLDIGVASAACALSATGCIPASSCNGGVWGEAAHAEDYPLVAFFARPAAIDALESAARKTGVGLENGYGGSVVIYGDSIDKLMQFASVLYDNRAELRP